MNEVIAVGALTDIGMRRTTNQDAFLAERGVYVVCGERAVVECGARLCGIPIVDDQSRHMRVRLRAVRVRAGAPLRGRAPDCAQRHHALHRRAARHPRRRVRGAGA